MQPVACLSIDAVDRNTTEYPCRLYLEDEMVIAVERFGAVPEHVVVGRLVCVDESKRHWVCYRGPVGNVYRYNTISKDGSARLDAAVALLQCAMGMTPNAPAQEE